MGISDDDISTYPTDGEGEKSSTSGVPTSFGQDGSGTHFDAGSDGADGPPTSGADLDDTALVGHGFGDGGAGGTAGVQDGGADGPADGSAVGGTFDAGADAGPGEGPGDSGTGSGDPAGHDGASDGSP
jgi:hypothetical protein